MVDSILKCEIRGFPGTLCPTQEDAQWLEISDISVLKSVTRSCACAIVACLLAGLPPNSGGIQRQSIVSCGATSFVPRTPGSVAISVVSHTGKLLRAGSVVARSTEIVSLPRQRKTRRQRYARKPRGLNIPLANTIAERPKEIGERNEFGHWEGDLIAFRKEFGKSNLTSLVERRSRYIVLTRNPSRHSMGVMAGIEHHLGPLPQTLGKALRLAEAPS